jgi:hypothetical protein|tara:strand:- start:46 stop:450 length:405 start_codon:yes stop_codon:yes gene_type:complete
MENKIKNYVIRSAGGIELNVNLLGNSDLSEKEYFVNNRKVKSLYLYCDNESFGEMSVEYDYSNDKNDDTLDQFYSGEFTNTLENILQEIGFSKDSTDVIGTSEFGAQEIGRASYDAMSIAEEMMTVFKLKYDYN